MLALGRKDTDEPFNSEDLALLTAVAGQVATAIENGRLYRQLHLKAEELGRMREFNENILESLDDGLVVFDADERIVRWNRALEDVLRRRRARDAIGRRLGDVFDAPFVEALRAARREHPVRRDAVPRAADVARDSETAAAARQRHRRCRCRTPSGDDAPTVGHDRCSSRTSPTACSSKSSCRSRRRWRRSACSPPASRTRSTRR